MKLIGSFFIVIVICTSSLFAKVTIGTISLSDTVLTFGSVETNMMHSKTVTISNLSDLPVQLAGIVFEENEFTAQYTENQIGPYASIDVTVRFSAVQNINYTDFMRVLIYNYNQPLIVKVEAQAVYNGDYYDLSQNKWDEELKTALHEIVKDHTSLGYTPARDYMYGSIDNVDGWVECVYTGRTAQFDTRTGANENSFNCEHTWPQSFFNENEPMRSDLFHLFPTDVNANSQRGNNDFGMVQSVTWTEGGSKLGSDSDGLIVFEPRDAHKGNVARSHFYFVVRYSGQYINYVNAAKMEAHFRDWNILDPVDTKEEQRNESIYALQHNRNPFIDHPEFADRILNFFGTGNRTPEPEIALSADRIELQEVYDGQDIDISIGIINSGKANLNVSQIITSNSKFQILNSNMTIPPESYQKVKIVYQPSGGEVADSTNIGVFCNDADENFLTVPVVLHFSPTSMVYNDESQVQQFALHQNYPNPFNPETTIRFEIQGKGFVRLEILNVLGQKLRTLVQSEMESGSHEYQFDAAGLPTGIYYSRLLFNNRVQIRKMLLVR